jgi:hypothetical protein
MWRANRLSWVGGLLSLLVLAALAAFPARKPADKGKKEVETVSTEVITGSKLSLEQIEEFLRQAQVKKIKGTSKGVAGSIRATLSDGKMSHDAHITTIDEEKSRFETIRGVELNFRDTYKFNIAAWRLARILGLVNMVPVSIDRRYQGRGAAFTWWVDNVMMDEETHLKKKINPPDVDAFNRQMYVVHVFDQLIFNTDRNLGNLLIDKNWRLWMIDHTRAFRLHTTLQNAKNLKKCDRVLLENLKGLSESQLSAALKDYVRPGEIRGLLARRDLIVKFFESQPPDSLYDMLKRP